MKEKFESRNLTGNIRLTLKDPSTGETTIWTADKAVLVHHIKTIVDDYLEQGYRLTLRQLYYQLVTKNAIRNHDTIYKKLSSILDDCRYSGAIDWDAIEDRGRVPYLPYTVDGIQGALQDAVDTYRINRQEGQKTHVELWTEKDAISGILRQVTSEYHVRLVVNKGYTSSSAIYGAYERFVECFKRGQDVRILYFGDHDPSGLDMVRDIKERLFFMFSSGDMIRTEEMQAIWKKWAIKEDGKATKAALEYQDDEDCAIEGKPDAFSPLKAFIKHHFGITHIGLTKKQIQQYNPPPNPTKITDPRAAGYIKLHGQTCYEVDALRPEVLVRIVRTNIAKHIDQGKYAMVLLREEEEKNKIASLIKDLK